MGDSFDLSAVSLKFAIKDLTKPKFEIMVNDIEAYKHGSFYEIFIHRAYKNSDSSKPGFHGSAIQNLITIENGDNSFVKWHGSLVNS